MTNTSLIDSTEVIKIIDHLKDIITPIGVEVYKVYYTQILYSGVVNTLADIIIIIIPTYISYKCYKKYESLVTNNDDMLQFFYTTIMICIIIVSALLVWNGVYSLQGDIMHIINPDYYIIQELLNKV